jgi:TPP-dependent indolepyruvate ferredoxin oxidoreductase alpha subunit
MLICVSQLLQCLPGQGKFVVCPHRHIADTAVEALEQLQGTHRALVGCRVLGAVQVKQLGDSFTCVGLGAGDFTRGAHRCSK